jgi:glycosyltransferase involved in cell wall biosynthesis
VIQPLITIGITCHNAADTIKRAIDSALAQDWPSLEVIMVDDCSTDDSVSAINLAIEGEPTARLICHERNAGVAAARNKIIENARGQFVAYFDDDDESVPDRLRTQWERIIGYERATGARLVFCYSNRHVVKYGESQPSHESLGIGRRRPEPHGPAVADFLLSFGAEPGFVWGQLGSCTLMASRKSFIEVGPFDASFRRCAELDLAIRAAFMGAHFIAVDRPLIKQYKTLSADKANAEPLKYQLRLRNKHRDYLKSRNFYWASRAIARADFQGFRSEFWKSRAWRLLAWGISPRLLRSKLHRRVSLVSRESKNQSERV